MKVKTIKRCLKCGKEYSSVAVHFCPSCQKVGHQIVNLNELRWQHWFKYWLETREKVCVTCGKPFLPHRQVKTQTHCYECIKERNRFNAEKYLLIRGIRSRFSQIAVNDFAQAEHIYNEMLVEEGPEFTVLATDGIITRAKEDGPAFYANYWKTQKRREEYLKTRPKERWHTSREIQQKARAKKPTFDETISEWGEEHES